MRPSLSVWNVSRLQQNKTRSLVGIALEIGGLEFAVQ